MNDQGGVSTTHCEIPNNTLTASTPHAGIAWLLRHQQYYESPNVDKEQGDGPTCSAVTYMPGAMLLHSTPAELRRPMPGPSHHRMQLWSSLNQVAGDPCVQWRTAQLAQQSAYHSCPEACRCLEHSLELPIHQAPWREEGPNPGGPLQPEASDGPLGLAL